MQSDIQKHIDLCVQCQVKKKSYSKSVPLQPLPLLDQPNQCIHVNLFGPLKTSEHSNKLILCIMNAFTKDTEVIPIPDKQAVTVANEIFIHWICRFGSPIQVHSNEGKEFCNKVSDGLYTLLGINHTKTSPAHS